MPLFSPLLAQGASLPFDLLDLSVLLGLTLAVSAYGMYMGRREEGVSDYFLAGKSIAWWAVAGSIFGTNISSHHLVGMMGEGLKEGFAQANYEFGAICGLLALCYFFLPLYRRMGVYTLSEYLGKRFDDRSRLLYSVSNVAFLTIQMCGTLVLGAITVETLMANSDYAVSFSTALVGLAVVATVYTVFGGLKAVIYTDVVQSVLLLVGAGVICVLALSHPEVGGIGGLLKKEPEKFHVFFKADHPQLPWTGVMTGLMLQHFYYWGTNQFMVQRALGAKSGWDGRMGIIAAGFFKLAIPFISIVPGMAAAYIVKIDPAATDTAFAELTKALLPMGYGLVGLVMAGLVGAILSTIDSMMNSAGTLFTFDIYRKYMDPGASEQRLILVGRISMVAVVAVAVTLSLVFGESRAGVFNKMVDYNGYLVPGIVVTFLAGLFMRSATATGALACIVAGPVISLLLHFGARNFFDYDLQAFHRVALAGLGCWGVLGAASRATASERSPDREQYLWRAYAAVKEPSDAVVRPWWQRDKVWAWILGAATLALVWRFF